MEVVIQRWVGLKAPLGPRCFVRFNIVIFINGVPHTRETVQVDRFVVPVPCPGEDIREPSIAQVVVEIGPVPVGEGWVCVCPRGSADVGGELQGPIDEGDDLRIHQISLA